MAVLQGEDLWRAWWREGISSLPLVSQVCTVTFRFQYTFMWNAVIHNNIAEEICWVTNQVCNKVWDSPAAGLVL